MINEIMVKYIMDKRNIMRFASDSRRTLPGMIPGTRVHSTCTQARVCCHAEGESVVSDEMARLWTPIQYRGYLHRRIN
jgi:hypothetical protein